MKTVRIKNKSRSVDIFQCKVYHTTIAAETLLTTPVSSSGVFTGLDLFNGINFVVEDHVDQFLIETITIDNCSGNSCTSCTNKGSGSISGNTFNNNQLFYINSGQFGRVDYEGEFSGSVNSSDDANLTLVSNNFTTFPNFTLTSIADYPYQFEGWYNNAARSGSALSTNTQVDITSGSFGGNTNWYVKYANNEPSFRLNAVNGTEITAFSDSRNENASPEDIATFYFSDLDLDPLTVSVDEGSTDHFNLKVETGSLAADNFVILSQVTSSLDYESKTNYNLSVTATDGTTSTTIPITITVIDNLAPVVASGRLGTFGENPTNGELIGELSGSVSDPEGDPITYVSFTPVSASIYGAPVDLATFNGSGYTDPSADPFEMSATGKVISRDNVWLNHKVIDKYIYALSVKDDYNDTVTGIFNVVIQPDEDTVTISTDGDNEVYVVESGTATDNVYDDNSGYTGSIASFTSNKTVTWSVTDPNSLLSINGSGQLSLGGSITPTYSDGDSFNADITATDADGRFATITITVHITPDISVPQVNGLFGTSSQAHVIESAVASEPIYYSFAMSAGTELVMTSDQAVTWDIEPNYLQIDSSGAVTVKTDISGSKSVYHNLVVPGKITATNLYGTTGSANFDLYIAENKAPEFTFTNTFSSNPTTNEALNGVTLVTASISDPEGDAIEHGEFNFVESTGELEAVRDNDVYYINALNDLSGGVSYTYTTSITDIHGFSIGSGTGVITVDQGAGYVSLTANKPTVSEGEIVTFTLNTQAVPNGTEVGFVFNTGSAYVLPLATEGIDFTTNTATNKFVINNNTATFDVNIILDNLTEPTEIFYLKLDEFDTLGNNTQQLEELVTINNVNTIQPKIYIYDNEASAVDVSFDYTSSYVDTLTNLFTSNNAGAGSEQLIDESNSEVMIKDTYAFSDHPFPGSKITSFSVSTKRTANTNGYFVNIIRYDKTLHSHTTIAKSNFHVTSEGLVLQANLADIILAADGTPSQNFSYMIEVQDGIGGLVLDEAMFALEYSDRENTPINDSYAATTFTHNTGTIQNYHYFRTLGIEKLTSTVPPTILSTTDGMISGSLVSHLASGSLGDTQIDLRDSKEAILLATASLDTSLEEALRQRGDIFSSPFQGQIVIAYPSGSSMTVPLMIRDSNDSTPDGAVFSWKQDSDDWYIGDGGVQMLTLNAPLDGYSNWFIFGSANTVNVKSALQIRLNDTSGSNLL